MNIKRFRHLCLFGLALFLALVVITPVFAAAPITFHGQSDPFVGNIVQGICMTLA